MASFLTIVLLLSSVLSINSQVALSRQNNIDFWPTSELSTHLNSPQPFDAAIMFYAPWDDNSQNFAGVFDRIGDILNAGTSSAGLVMVFFDCEQDTNAQRLCQDLGVTSYPTVSYLGAGPCPESDSFTRAVLGNKLLRAGENSHERMCNFQGNFNIGEQVRDFIVMMRAVSKWNKFDENVVGAIASKFWGLFGLNKIGDHKIGVDPALLAPTAEATRPSTAANSASSANSADVEQLILANAELEAATNQAAILMDALLTDQEPPDAFEVLGAKGGWDGDAETILRSCIIDLTLDFCSREVTRLARDNKAFDSNAAGVADYEILLMERLSDEEPYCGVFEMCYETSFANDACRPEICPFRNTMGCKYASTCLDATVQSEYELMLASQ